MGAAIRGTLARLEARLAPKTDGAGPAGADGARPAAYNAGPAQPCIAMSIKSDKWIRRMAEQHGMIEPFEPGQVRAADGQRIVSYGVSSYGYDVRRGRVQGLHQRHSAIVDPKNSTSRPSWTSGPRVHHPAQLASPWQTVEYLEIPRNVIELCRESTYRVASGRYPGRPGGRHAHPGGDGPSAEGGEMFWGYSMGPARAGDGDAPRRAPVHRAGLAARSRARQRGADPARRTTSSSAATAGCWTRPRLRPGDRSCPCTANRPRLRGDVAAPTGHLEPTHRLADEWNVRGESTPICRARPPSRRPRPSEQPAVEHRAEPPATT